MIADAHCHAWRHWPYERDTPDSSTRGSGDALLRRLDEHHVERAVVICARIGGGRGGDGRPNDDNNQYVVDLSRRHFDRLDPFPDVDGYWRLEYHTPGAHRRLMDILDASGARGFTHYLGNKNDGWLTSDDGMEFFRTAMDRRVILSLSASGPWFADIAAVARAHPRLPILMHHMGLPRSGPNGFDPHDLQGLAELAACSNVHLKVSGFRYNDPSPTPPFTRAHELLSRLIPLFGIHRLHWGSDFPVSGRDLGYTASLDLVRARPDLSPESKRLLLGENLISLLRVAG